MCEGAQMHGSRRSAGRPPRARCAALCAGVLLAVTACSGGVSRGRPPTPTPSASVHAVTGSVSAPTSSAARSTTRPRTRSSSSPAPRSSAVIPPVSFPPGSGPVVVLNPGHNGGNATHAAEIARQVPAGFGQYKACDTTGTSTDAGYPEHAFTWDVTLRVRAILQAHGVRVVLTRPNDTGVGPCVDQRAAIGNATGVAAVVSIHADGAPAGDHGFHVCYASRPPAGATIEAHSVALSTAVHNALAAGSGLVPATYIGDGRGYFPRSDLAGLNLAIRPATFLEIGNMRNASDAATLSSTSGRARIAAAVAAGILSYLGRA